VGSPRRPSGWGGGRNGTKSGSKSIGLTLLRLVFT
jgi:hypothetical protein